MTDTRVAELEQLLNERDVQLKTILDENEAFERKRDEMMAKAMELNQIKQEFE